MGGAADGDDLGTAVGLDGDGVAETGAVSCDVVVVVVVAIGVVVDVVIIGVSIIIVGEGAAAEAELDQRLQGWEAGAGDADRDFDGGPDEGADVGPGDVCLVDVEDGPDADDGGAADAVRGERSVSVGCGGGLIL